MADQLELLEAVVVGSGEPGLMKVALGSGEGRFISDVPVEYLPPSARRPGSRFNALVLGREFVRAASYSHVDAVVNEIRSVLSTDWNPLGIAQFDDEYEQYIIGIFFLLESDTSEQAIAEHLLSIEHQTMNLEGTQMDQLLKVAAKLRRLQVPNPKPAQTVRPLPPDHSR